jgi:Tol biopolymer transport system component
MPLSTGAAELIVNSLMPSTGSGASWRSSGLLLLTALAAGCGAEVGDPTHIEPVSTKSSASAAAWSPDGRQVAFVRYRRGTTPGIWVVDTTGVGPHPILAGSWGFLDWSPDGTRLAISAAAGIYTVKLNGDSLKQITTTGYAPRWSPDGRELAFQTRDTTGIGTIWIVSRDGTGLRSLAPPGTDSWGDPDWSPDGTHLVHIRRSVSTGLSDVYVMDTTGHAEQRLTMSESVQLGPAWSPDGKWIAWSNGTTIELWIMRPDGTEAHMLTSGGDLSWSPDSRRIAYSLPAFETTYLVAIDIVTLRGTTLAE